MDASVDGTWQRVAHAPVDAEDKTSRKHWYGRFLQALRSGAIPVDRIISNAGALGCKSTIPTIDYAVSRTIQDSMGHILEKVHEVDLMPKVGRGTDYELSTLRPRGAYASGAGACTNGPLSFMDIYDKMCFTVNSAGDRHGAQASTFDVGHPDVREFICARHEDGRLCQFDSNLLTTGQFMQVAEQDADWPLVFPVHVKERNEINLNNPNAMVRYEQPVQDDHVQHAGEMIACRVYGRIHARHLQDMIMVSTYGCAEPGFILIDRVNGLSNNWQCEAIRATSPCGEQPLSPYGSYLLGLANLIYFIEQPFSDEARFGQDCFRGVVRVFTRMLNNVAEVNGLPLKQQRQEIFGKRRRGMGFLDLDSTLVLPKLRYGGPEACVFAEEVAREIALVGREMALELAREKGSAPILTQDYEVTAETSRKRPEMAADGYKAGGRIRGSVLHAKYPHYMQRIAEYAPKLIEASAETGARFTHHSSTASIGTISLSPANDASNGIEPGFAHHHPRNLIREGRKIKEKVEVYSCELLAYRALVNAQALPDNDDLARCLPDYFIIADSVTPAQYVDIQTAAQKWVDSSISKTASVPADHPLEDFKDICRCAWHQGFKGCTTFRLNPEAFRGVLVKESDLERIRYRFELEDGSVVGFRGNEQAEYDGEIYIAASLFDALREDYYGKYQGRGNRHVSSQDRTEDQGL